MDILRSFCVCTLGKIIKDSTTRKTNWLRTLSMVYSSNKRLNSISYKNAYIKLRLVLLLGTLSSKQIVGFSHLKRH